VLRAESVRVSVEVAEDLPGRDRGCEQVGLAVRDDPAKGQGGGPPERLLR